MDDDSFLDVPVRDLSDNGSKNTVEAIVPIPVAHEEGSAHENVDSETDSDDDNIHLLPPSAKRQSVQAPPIESADDPFAHLHDPVLKSLTELHRKVDALYLLLEQRLPSKP